MQVIVVVGAASVVDVLSPLGGVPMVVRSVRAFAGADVCVLVAGDPAPVRAACAVLGVPVQSKALSGLDSLLSIVQMPAGVPVGTLAIGKAGAKNAALLAASIVGLCDEGLAARVESWRAEQTASVPETVED